MVSFTVSPLTGHTGAEVIGLDFTKPIATETRTILSRAFAKHHVLVMRDQHFTPGQFKVAAQLFGQLHQSERRERHVPDHPDVFYISNDEIVNGKRIIPGETFHTDNSNHPSPPKATMLFAVELPSSGTPNTSTCTTHMTTCPRTSGKESTGSGRCTSISASTARAHSVPLRKKASAACTRRASIRWYEFIPRTAARHYS